MVVHHVDSLADVIRLALVYAPLRKNPPLIAERKDPPALETPQG